MTKLEALQQLAEKVGAGADTAHDHANAFPSESAYGHCTWHDSHKASTQRDMNAALYLHNAVLPNRYWSLCEWDGAWTAQIPISATERHECTSERSPAHALLSVDLIALIAIEQQNQGDV